jgi:predicted ribosome quality control (RQC) complex YloA/Tae2 family protein
MDFDQKTRNVLLIDELTSLVPMRLQDVFGVGKNVLVFELYSPKTGRLFLINDRALEHYTLHVQRERVRGIKTSSSSVLKLKKFKGALLWFVKDEQGTLRAFIKTQEAALALCFKSGLLEFFDESNAIVPKIIDREPVFLHNFSQAERYRQMYEQSLNDERKHAIEKLLKKKLVLIKNIEGDLSNADAIIANESDAKLLASNMHLIKKGMTSIELCDYSHEPPQKKTISIDNKMAPAAFLAKTFNKIKKAKRALEHITPRLLQLREELSLLKEQLANVGTWDLAKKETPKPPPKKAEQRLPYRSFKSSDGLSILVGKTDKDNDTLIVHYAKGNEWWFHVREGTGSHVVVKSAKDALPEQSFVEAAMLAAHFSRQKNEATVEVIYTRIKHVKKSKGMKPGQVLVSQEKSVLIRMDPKTIASLLTM